MPCRLASPSRGHKLAPACAQFSRSLDRTIVVTLGRLGLARSLSKPIHALHTWRPAPEAMSRTGYSWGHEPTSTGRLRRHNRGKERAAAEGAGFLSSGPPVLARAEVGFPPGRH
jgi:hypothetical protein